MSFNLGVNQKYGNYTLDLKKIKEPLEIELVNDMEGQVTFHRKRNSLTITAYATKITSQESKYRVFYEFESNIIWESDKICDHTISCLEYTSIGGKYDWYWNSQRYVDEKIEIDDGFVIDKEKMNNVTFYVYDENGNLVQKQTYYINQYSSNEKAEALFNEHKSEYEAYKKDEIYSAVVDYSRVLAKFTITNVNYYKGGTNDIYLTLGSTMSTYNLLTATFEVSGDKKNKFDGTNFNENFYGTDFADKIYTGGGSDTINGNKGNDKIYISGNGIKTVNINYGDGNDTIYNAQKAGYTDIYFDTDELYYQKNSNNLTILRRYDDNSVESTTITNFFNKKPNVYVNTPSEESYETVMSKLSSNDIKLLLSSNKSTITGSAFSDQIVAGNNTKTVKAKEGDNLIITSESNKYAMSLSAGKGDDIYNINNLSKKITISDSGGNDQILITDDNYSKDDLFLYYDIKLKKDGSLETENNLHILSVDDNDGYSIKSRKGKLSENLVIKNCMFKNGASSGGWIEKISVSGDNFNPDYASLESEVASWLADSNFSSVSTAIKKASADEIQSLMQIYMNYT